MDDADRAQFVTDRALESLIERRRMAATNYLSARAGGDTLHCVDCLDEIPRERLLVVPGARRCVACQTVAEVSDVA